MYLSLSVENRGIAPFYYPLSLSLSTNASSGTTSYTLSSLLHKLQPGTTTQITNLTINSGDEAPSLSSPLQLNFSLSSSHILSTQHISFATSSSLQSEDGVLSWIVNEVEEGDDDGDDNNESNRVRMTLWAIVVIAVVQCLSLSLSSFM